jgi:hypothetical protein
MIGDDCELPYQGAEKRTSCAYFQMRSFPKNQLGVSRTTSKKSNTYVLDFARHPWRANQAAQKLRFSAACYTHHMR